MRDEATIVGVATGRADGGVAIVRISGPQARAIAEKKVGSLPPPRVLGRRRLHLAGSVEDALVVQMPGPRSFTGEDVVELQVHGGARGVREIVDALLAAGCVAAGPGEFSRRAFFNGRLSLDQAEGIAALVAAETQAGVDQARRLIAGEIGDQVDALRGAIEGLRAEVEANLDFAEDLGEEDAAAVSARWGGELALFVGTLDGWLRRFERGRRARERPRIVLAGPPNAGKSALLNALLGYPRALVAAEAGTTRDYVEAPLDLEGIEALLIDTAGLREVGAGAEEAIEAAGIVRSREQIRGGDLVLWIEAVDADEAVGARDTSQENMFGEGVRVLRIENKRDLGIRRPSWIGVSAATGGGLAELRRQLVAAVTRDEEGAPWIGLARHRDRAAEARGALAAATDGLREGTGWELIAFDLGIAERRLAEISGRHALGAVGEEVLARIFSRFCIGK